LEVGGWLLVVA